MSDERLPFEVSYVELTDHIDHYVERVFEALMSDYLADFMVVPRGSGFVFPQAFYGGYTAIADATNGFRSLDSEAVLKAVLGVPMAFVVLRTMLGLSPPEWASVATVSSGETLTQGFARSLERSIRMDPAREIGHTPLQETRIRALVSVACDMLLKGASRCKETEVHRLDKVDTVGGLHTIRRAASEGIRYESLLYERFLGRPFASHRDSVSELVGGTLEDRIDEHLSEAEVPFHRSKRGESLQGWEQNPDFFCPDPYAPGLFTCLGGW